MDKYLTSEQVAAQLQVHPFTVLKYLKSGRLPGIKIGRMYRIKESDVEKFLSSVSTSRTSTAAASEPKKESKEEPKEEPKEQTHDLKIEKTKEDDYYTM